MSRPITEAEDDAGGASDSGGMPPGLTTTTSSSNSTGDGTSDDSAGEGSSDSGRDEGGGCFSFFCPGDLGTPIECDTFAQDCPSGEKCTPWANDGGNTWNATRCAPVADTPDAVGEPCLVEGSAVSGVDTCVVGAMCWNVDPQTNEGQCIALCGGSNGDPQCAAGSSCSQSAAGVLALCLISCDPLAQDCDADEVCVGATSGESAFICAPDASGGMGVQGEACEAVNGCTAGFACINPDWVPGCGAGVGCCTAFCNITDPNPPCPAGVPCTAWFEAGQAPPGFDEVGVCAVEP